ncbi:hypothetical protein [Bdellovibrio sp. HCB274]|uniref:hypothetical protein n=1 Tax=Bdellovibrio sp. HCB274 TaxID=3394361 RepID=UPI0039B53A52
MKLAEIVEILKLEFASTDVKEINKGLKAKSELKFRLTGSALGHFGFTGQIKSISEDGVKVYKSNRVVLIPLEDIETFGKPNSRDVRVARKGMEKKVVEAKPAKPAKPAKAKAPRDDDEGDGDDFDEDDDFGFDEELPVKKGKKGAAPTGKSGSRFIPVKK